MNLTAVIIWGSNSAISNLFTCDVKFSVWRRYLGCQCDDINIKNFREILRYLFQILATLLSSLETLLFLPFAFLNKIYLKEKD